MGRLILSWILRYACEGLWKLSHTLHALGSVDLTAFIFNSKEEITDKMENAACCQFFVIPEEDALIHKGKIETI